MNLRYLKVGDKHQILHDSQEGLEPKYAHHNNYKTIMSTLEDARFTNPDIYVLYVDFKKTFGLIN